MGRNEIKTDKGKFQGSCNRTACQAPNAIYFNHSTRKWYCRECATLLNNTNQDWAINEYGHNLCTPIDDSEEY